MKYYQRKPSRRPEPQVIVAAQYHAGGDLSELALVHANVAECQLPTGTVLVARWIATHDDHPETTEYEVVEDGEWLCGSASYDRFDNYAGLWADTTAGLAHWYDEVDKPEPQPTGYVWAPGLQAQIDSAKAEAAQPQPGWSETSEDMWRRVQGLPRVGDQPDGGQ